MERPNVTFLDELVHDRCAEPGSHSAGARAEGHPGRPAIRARLLVPGTLMGSGPFKFVSWVPQQAMVLEAFDDFYFGSVRTSTEADSGDHPLQRRDPDRPAARGGRYVTVRGGVSLAANKEFLPGPAVRRVRDPGRPDRPRATPGTTRIERLRDPRIREAFWIGVDWVRRYAIGSTAACAPCQRLAPVISRSSTSRNGTTRFAYNPNKARDIADGGAAGYSLSRVPSTSRMM